MSANHYPHLRWTEKARRRLLGLGGYDVYMSRRRDAEGRKADFAIVEAPDWCQVIAPVRQPDGANSLVMVRQFRHASQSITLEFPGGVVDPGEAPALSAARELTEETGFVAARLELIGVTYPNPAIMTNRAYTFLARDAAPAGTQALDEHELLDAELVPEEEIRLLIRPDFHTHSIMMCAVAWYELYLKDGLTFAEREQRWTAAEA